MSCIGEMGRLAELQRQYEGTGVNFLGVCTDVAGNTGSMANTAKSLMDSVNCTYPVMVYNAALTSGISYLPTTRVYDSAGNIIARYTGALNDQEWINIIETLMAQQA